MTIGRLTPALALLPLVVACSRERAISSPWQPKYRTSAAVAHHGTRDPLPGAGGETPSADVLLAARADLHTRVRDRDSGMTVAVRLLGATPASAASRGDAIAYAGAAPHGGDVFARRTPSGAEDFVDFVDRPPSEELVYTADVSAAAGLRLVGDVLELLDRDGTPRLRMAAPYLVDVRGRRVDAKVTLDDCAADTSTQGPWGRPVTAPGRDECRVRVSWTSAHVEYPAVLDPSWTSTKSSMVAARSFHTATLLPNGTVLIAGGVSGTGQAATYLSSAELFDPKTDTFAATGSMTGTRAEHVAVLLDDGRVLVAGGRDGAGALTSTEVYDAGKFHAAGFLHGTRTQAAATLLGSKMVMIAGGIDGSGNVLDTAEEFDATSEEWAAIPAMLHKRVGHYLTTLADSGDALVVAGISTTSLADLANAETYADLTRKWAATGSLVEPRYDFGGATLADGTVLVASGYEISKSGCTAGAEIYDSNKQTWSKAGTLATARAAPTLTALSGGGAVAVGGVVRNASRVITAYLKSVELYDPTSKSWSALPDLKQARYGHTATLLKDGRVLVAGGGDDKGAVATAELLTLDADGTACKSGATCASGFCVDGVCCETACDATCNGCASASTGKADGTCAPARAGKDPHGDCKDDGAPACKKDGFCDGKGACENYTSASCTPSPCTADDDCTSGFCADGICCDSACDGKCEACTKAKKGTGADGTCGPVAKSTDPDGDCGTLGTGVCKGPATCDGAGACLSSLAGKDCAPATCSDDVTLAMATTCGSAGDCTPDTVDCTPFLCDAKAVACTTSCAADADCAPGAKCKSLKCQKKENGATCTDAVECTSGFCADGYCCDKACTGQCEACDGDGTAGTCKPQAGAPKNGRPACDGGGTCAGTCNGVVADLCIYPHSDTTCEGESSCADGSETVSRCNGSGLCVPTPRQCAPYACGNDACKSTCTTDAECATGVHCDSDGKCTPGKTLSCKSDDSIALGDGGVETCAPYLCAGGACTTSCSTDRDCAAGARCKSGKCEAPGGGGCGCRLGSRGFGGDAFGLVLAALAGARLRRRRASKRRKLQPASGKGTEGRS